jgi:xylitol oxidase
MFVVFVSMAVVAGDVVPTRMEKTKRTNWATNIPYNGALHEITAPEQVPAAVRSLAKVTPVGTGHTFNKLADSPHNQISLRQLHKVLALNEESLTVTAQAGITYDQLCPYLASKNYALHNLASLTQLSIVGACSTSTHGSGDHNGNLATAVTALELVTADGTLVHLSRHDQDFPGVLVGLGAFGIITQITLDIQPAFTVQQYVYVGISFHQLRHHFDTIMASAYSVSVFTDWRHPQNNEIWIKSLAGTFTAPGELFGATLANEKLHPVRGLPAETCTEQMGEEGASYERLPHFRMGCTPSVGEELQSEYFMARGYAAEVILALEGLWEEITTNVFVSEIRTVAGDELWMSACYRRASVAIGFTWKPDWVAIERLLPKIERALAPFDPRPHWGKLFHFSPGELRSKYEKMDEFASLAAKYDPQGKFRNEFLNSYIFTP